MKLGIDFRPALLGGAGIARYVREMCRAMPPLLGSGDELVLFSVAFARHKHLLMDTAPFEEHPRVKIIRFRFPNRILHALGRLGFSGVEMFTGKLDMFLYTDFVYPPLKKARSALVLYDLLFMHECGFHGPAFCRRMTKRVSRAMKAASGLIVPTRAVLDDIKRFFPELDIPVKVIPMAGRHMQTADSEKKTGPAVLPDRYFLCVGTLEPRKNHVRVLHAFEEAEASMPGIKLVIAGRRGWGEAPFRSRLRNSPARDRIILFEEVDDSMLTRLYKGAIALVYPSLGEGFGLPVVEAMSIGCPVVASDLPPFPEVAGMDAVLVDPFDPDAIRSALVRVANDRALRDRLIHAGARRVASLSWRRTAAETLGFMHELVANPDRC